MNTPRDVALSEAARAKPPARGELVACFVALSVLVILQILSSGTIHLLTHPLWLDECLTELIANDPSFTHAMQAIRGGVETNPPTFYLFLWPLGKLLGGWSATSLRLFAAGSMLLAMTGLYAICR